MEIPKLEQGKFTVIRADYKTGKILNNDDSFYQSSGENYYHIFDTIELAKSHIVNNKKECAIICEYLIYNYQGTFVEIIRP